MSYRVKGEQRWKINRKNTGDKDGGRERQERKETISSPDSLLKHQRFLHPKWKSNRGVGGRRYPRRYGGKATLKRNYILDTTIIMLYIGGVQYLTNITILPC